MSLNTLLEDFAKAKAAFQEQAKSSLKTAFRLVFEEYPGITAFRWTQYTPYFNDGEPCEFRVGDIYVTNIPVDSEEFKDICPYGDYEGDSDDVCSYREYDKKYFSCSSYSMRNELFRVHPVFAGKDLTNLTALISALDSSNMEEVLQDTFGDHVYVTVTRGGFEIEEYDHE